MPGDWSMAGPEASPVRLVEQDAFRNFGQMAQANYTNVLAQKQTDEMDRQKKIAAAFANPSTTKPDGTPLSQSEMIFNDAEKMRNLGMPEEAAKLGSEGALTASREVAARVAESKSRLDAIKGADDTLTAISQFFDGVTDQAGFDRANAMVTAVTGMPSPLMGRPYSPEIVGQLKRAQMTARQRAMLPYEVQKAQAQAESIRSLMAYRKARLGQYQAIIDARREKDSSDKKAGGTNTKDVGNPTEVETVQAAGMIRQAYPDLPREDLGHYSYLIAAEARRIRKQNPGISAEEANRRAMEEQAPSIQEIVTTEKVLGSEAIGAAVGASRKVPRYQPRPGPAPKPPAGETQIPEVAKKGMKFQEGKLYLLPNGKKGIRKGNGFELVE